MSTAHATEVYEAVAGSVQRAISSETDRQLQAAREERNRLERQRIFEGFVATREQVLDNIVTREELELAGFEFDPYFGFWRRGFV